MARRNETECAAPACIPLLHSGRYAPPRNVAGKIPYRSGDTPARPFRSPCRPWKSGTAAQRHEGRSENIFLGRK